MNSTNSPSILCDGQSITTIFKFSGAAGEFTEQPESVISLFLGTDFQNFLQTKNNQNIGIKINTDQWNRTERSEVNFVSTIKHYLGKVPRKSRVK